MFTEILMEEVGFEEFSEWNAAFVSMSSTKKEWSFHCGSLYSRKNKGAELASAKRNPFDVKQTFDDEIISELQFDTLYRLLKMNWDDSGVNSKIRTLSRLNKAVVSMNQYKSFYEVFSISESNSQEQEDLEKLDFDSFLFLNRSQFRYLWLVFLRYFWDYVYQLVYNKKLKKVFDNASDSSPFKTSTFDTSQDKKISGPSSSGDSEEQDLDTFVREVLKMKKELFPLKKHLGLILFGILEEADSSKRPSLEELRDLIQGQYYSIIAQGKKTFGLEPKKEVAEKSNIQMEQEVDSESIIDTQESGVEIPEVSSFNFDLDLIVKMRRSENVISIKEGKAVTKESKSGKRVLTVG
jgi:hypothetical protein